MKLQLDIPAGLAKGVKKIGNSLSPSAIMETIDKIGPEIGQLNAARRKAAESLEKGGEVKSGKKKESDFAESAIKALHEIFTHAEPVLIKELGEVLKEFAGSGVLSKGLAKFLSSCGASDDEVKWLMKECSAIEFNLVDIAANGDVENLKAILKSFQPDADHPHCAGFPRFTGDPDTDARIADAVGRCRAKGITLSLFHMLILAVALALVMNAQESNPSKGQLAASFGG